MSEVKIPSTLRRAGVVEEVRGGDDMRVELSFSSEEPFRRELGIGDDWEPFFEILGHGEGEVDLSRLQTGRAPLLADHTPRLDAQLGIVESARIVDGRGRATARFSGSARGREMLERVRSGEVTSVSVGYGITKLERVGVRDGLPVLRAHWAPYEISLVAIPADPSVGVGRSGAAPATITMSLTEDPDMPVETPPVDQGTRAAATVPAAPTPPVSPAPPPPDANAIRAEERERVASIDRVAREYDLPLALVASARKGEIDLDTFYDRVLAHMSSAEATATRSKGGEIGLTERERDSFSVMNVIRHLVQPSDTKAREAAAFELECSRAAEAQYGRATRGILVPSDVLLHGRFSTPAAVAAAQRAQNVGGATAGGNLVATDHLAGSFIDLLRNSSAILRAGATMLSGLVGNVDIPRRSGAGTAYWVGEGAGPTVSQGTFDKVQLSPKTLAAATEITRRMMLQGTPDIEGLVRADLVAVMTLAMDLQALYDQGDADAPVALDEVLTANDWAGATPTWAEVVAMETRVATANALMGNLSYLMPAGIRGALKTTPKDAGSGRFIMEGGEVNGYPGLLSNQITPGQMWFGNWSDFLIGTWSGLDLSVDTAALAASGGVVLRAFQDLDFGLRHPESIDWAYNSA